MIDLGLPDIDGIEVTRACGPGRLRPIIVVSARGHERQKVEALDAGADDYVTKPFGLAELVARVRAALRRVVRMPGSGEHDRGRRDAAPSRRSDGHLLEGHARSDLTPIEFRLLALPGAGTPGGSLQRSGTS